MSDVEYEDVELAKAVEHFDLTSKPFSASEIAADQGSTDLATVVENYWSERERRQHRRRYMRSRLSEAFSDVS